MSDTWVNLLIQVPLVGVFIWFALTNQREFMAALDKRDEAFEKRNAAVIAAIDRLNAAIDARLNELASTSEEHDRWVRENVNRVRPARQ